MSHGQPSSLLSPGQVAERLALPLSSVYRLIRRGDLAAHNIGTPRRPMYRVSEQQLGEYLEARQTRPAVPALSQAGRRSRH